ncbi:hypothetical protein HK405_003195 [Cladochytrium tenue]|nr:hypothetical protein HK405_003195 [Cladochytrium tenue]
MKCKACKALGNANILKETLRPYSGSGELRPFVTVESRGLAITGWRPTPGQTFAAENPDSGASFDDIQFDEEDWVGYDEAAACPVGVMDLKWEVKKA